MLLEPVLGSALEVTVCETVAGRSRTTCDGGPGGPGTAGGGHRDWVLIASSWAAWDTAQRRGMEKGDAESALTWCKVHNPRSPSPLKWEVSVAPWG